MADINLAGQWDFIADVEQKGIDNKFFEKAEWSDTMQLPGTVSEQKKVPQNNERNAGYLTDPYSCTGFMWFRKKITVKEIAEDCTYKLLLERTRVSHLWIDGKCAGENNSLCGKHIYDISNQVKAAGGREMEIIIMIDNISYPTKGGHLTSPDTQTNWIGITGEIKILVEPVNNLTQLRVYTAGNGRKSLRITCNYTGTASTAATIKLFELNESEAEAFACKNIEKNSGEFFGRNIELKTGENDFTMELPAQTKLWTAEHPYLYELVICGDNFCHKMLTGIKSFEVNGTHFEINGRREFLRGKHDGMIFPKTGYAPCNVEDWLTVMKTAKNYGINHYRFHTCCPPEAAFTAADILGIYMEPELPFWGTIQNIGEEGFNQAEQDYLISEGLNILNNFGNHTSFVMMSMGNELWGSGERLNYILKNYHDYDNRHLYTSGSNNFQFWPQTMEYENFFVGCRFDQKSLIRGSYAMCDAPQGFIQTEEPCTNHDYDLCFSTPVTPVSAEEAAEDKEIEIQYGTGIKKVKASSVSTSAHFLPGKPVLSHEVGQYCMYPDFREIEKYTGVLKPYNYEIFRERLKTSGMEDLAGQFFRDSSRLAVQCYKQEIEAIIRSNELSGFQLLDIQDFTGQGTAVVGILDSFMESKGIVNGEQWRSFCDKTVLLSSFEKFVWAENENFSADIILSNYSDKSYKGDVIWAYLIDTETNEIIEEESYENNNPVTGNKLLGTFKCSFPQTDEYKKYNLVLYLNSSDNQEILNSYVLHVYPETDDEVCKMLGILKEKGFAEYKGVSFTTDCQRAKQLASAGTKVVLIPQTIDESVPGVRMNAENKPETVPGTYCTDFWCYPMFRSISEGMKKPVPVGTLGLTIQNKSKIFDLFPTDTYTTPKWYNIISNATCINLLDSDIQPEIQMIDNFERNWKLGIVYKTENILVCTSRLYDIADKCEVSAFIKSIVAGL